MIQSLRKSSFPFYSILAFQFFSIYPAAAILDTNANGMSDVWEKQYNANQLFTTNSAHASTADPDQDGWTNAQEAIAGTSPFDSSTHNQKSTVTISHTSVAGLLQLDHPKLLGKNYQLQGSYDLLTWYNINESYLAQEHQHTVLSSASTTDGAPASRYFWRTRITDADTDLDDLSDYEENILGTNPYHNDSDNDGILDKMELTRN